MDDLLNTAVKAVQSASQICQQIQAQLVREDSLTKNDRSPVTVADFASQAVICKTLKEHFPDIPIVGEEDADSLRQKENESLLNKIASFLPDWKTEEILDQIDRGNGEPASLFWTLDPIDGTKGFLRGDQYAVALALIRGYKVVMGVLGCPNLPFEKENADGTIMYASKGGGAFARAMNGSRTREAYVSQNSISDTVRFLESVESGHANHGLQGQIMGKLGDRAQSVRYDSQVKYAVLAQSTADVYLRLPSVSKPDYREKIWDHAAGLAVVEEAGGKVTDMSGKDLDFSSGKKLINNRGVIVTNGKLHQQIIDMIKE